MGWLIAIVVAVVVAVVAVVVAVVAAPAVAAVAVVIAIVAAVVAVILIISALIDTFLLVHNEVDEFKSECKFGWSAKYRIEDIGKCILQITLRIKLIFDSSISEQEKTDAKNIWEQAIEDMWTDKFKLSRTNGNCKCEEYTVQVDVDWVESGEHHTVNVAPGNDRSDMTHWFIEDDGITVAHEAGHMLGNADEYEEDDVCPDRDVRTDNTIMGSGNEVKTRHYQRFADWLTNNVRCPYEVVS